MTSLASAHQWVLYATSADKPLAIFLAGDAYLWFHFEDQAHSFAATSTAGVWLATGRVVDSTMPVVEVRDILSASELVALASDFPVEGLRDCLRLFSEMSASKGDSTYAGPEWVKKGPVHHTTKAQGHLSRAVVEPTCGVPYLEKEDESRRYHTTHIALRSMMATAVELERKPSP